MRSTVNQARALLTYCDIDPAPHSSEILYRHLLQLSVGQRRWPRGAHGPGVICVIQITLAQYEENCARLGNRVIEFADFPLRLLDMSLQPGSDFIKGICIVGDHDCTSKRRASCGVQFNAADTALFPLNKLSCNPDRSEEHEIESMLFPGHQSELHRPRRVKSRKLSQFAGVRTKGL